MVLEESPQDGGERCHSLDQSDFVHGREIGPVRAYVVRFTLIVEQMAGLVASGHARLEPVVIIGARQFNRLRLTAKAAQP